MIGSGENRYPFTCRIVALDFVSVGDKKGGMAMLGYCSSVCMAIFLLSFLSSPCQGKGRWGAEFSTSLKNVGLIRSLSPKNELLVRLQYNWSEYLEDEREEVRRDEYADTTYEYEYSYDGDRSEGMFSVELGFRRFIGSGKGLSPNLGLAVKFWPQRYEYLYDRYEEDSLDYSYRHTDRDDNVSLLLNGGCRYLISEYFAVSVHTDLLSYTYTWHSREHESKNVQPDGEIRTHESAYTGTCQYLQLVLYPSLYVQFYF